MTYTTRLSFSSINPLTTSIDNSRIWWLFRLIFLITDQWTYPSLNTIRTQSRSPARRLMIRIRSMKHLVNRLTLCSSRKKKGRPVTCHRQRGINYLITWYIVAAGPPWPVPRTPRVPTEVCTKSPAPAKTLALRPRITPHLKGYQDNTLKVLRNRT